MNFRFTTEHLLISIIMIFPSTKITIFEFFPKNHSNSGNFLYSIVDLTKILGLARILIVEDPL